MVKKEFTYRGKNLDELKQLSIAEFAALVPSRQRRTLKRDMPEPHKRLLRKIEKGSKNIETHCRDMIILPSMLGAMIRVHNGKTFEQVRIEPEMLGHRLGEFALSRKKVAHSSPGVGATRSSQAISAR